MDLTTATPVEIDTLLAEIYGKQWEARQKRDRQIVFAEEIEEGVRKYREEGAQQYRSWSLDQAVACREKAAAQQEIINGLRDEAAPLDAEYIRRGGWERFYSVRDGHIHSSMDCSTCNKMGKPTEFGWIPEWSGRSEDEALEALITASNKTILCTVCYPSAPVAWTTPREDDDTCPGSGTGDYPRETARLGYYSGNYAICSHCGQQVTVNKGSFRMRKHKKA